MQPVLKPMFLCSQPLLREIIYDCRVPQKPRINLRKVHLHRFFNVQNLSSIQILHLHYMGHCIKKKKIYRFQRIIKNKPTKVKGEGEIVHMVLANNDVVPEITHITSRTAHVSVSRASAHVSVSQHHRHVTRSPYDTSLLLKFFSTLHDLLFLPLETQHRTPDHTPYGIISALTV